MNTTPGGCKVYCTKGQYLISTFVYWYIILFYNKHLFNSRLPILLLLFNAYIYLKFSQIRFDERRQSYQVVHASLSLIYKYVYIAGGHVTHLALCIWTTSVLKWCKVQFRHFFSIDFAGFYWLFNVLWPSWIFGMP